MSSSVSFRSLLALRKSLSRLESADRSDYVFVEGRAHIKHCLEHSKWPLVSLALSNKARTKEIEQTDDLLSKLVHEQLAINQPTSQVICLNDSQIERLSSVQSSAGYLACFDARSTPSTIDWTKPGLLLDSINDAGNMGSLIRSALAFRFNQVIAINSCNPFQSKAIAASAGTIANPALSIRLVSEAQRGKFINFLTNLDRSSTRFHALTAAGGSALDIRSINQPHSLDHNRSADYVMMGSESHGLSAELLQLADCKWTIPMQHDVESLNVGHAAAIAMYSLSTTLNKSS